ncbi:calpain-A-like [Neodiprion pinetum]|uniref:calpain-A-like n=1 Tax=Neodiprion pinetum TaxID=441929 RepID=UPI001EE0EF57|nr:calpain-A-like [Neodiprion pinetum]
MSGDSTNSPFEYCKKTSETLKQCKVYDCGEAFGNLLVQHNVSEGGFVGANVTTIFKLGEEGSGIKPRGPIQDYDQLKKECLASGKSFEDPLFPRTSTLSVPRAGYDNADIVYRDIAWIRAKDIPKDKPAEFVVDGTSRMDIAQGKLADCWFQAGLSALAMNPILWSKVVPKGQSFREGEYAGIFHFRFWYFGKWVDVVVDDYLPMLWNGSQSVYAHSTENNEFWCALLTKAYAKLYDDWGAVNWGACGEAMEDFTGGIVRVYSNDDENLFNNLLDGQEENALMACMRPRLNDHGPGNEAGLFEGHVYTVTKVYTNYVDGNDRVEWVRLRDPYGKYEWTGELSEGSREWKEVPEKLKKELEMVTKRDGEFWMPFKKFKSFFTIVEICYIIPKSLTDGSSREGKTDWQVKVFEGEWLHGVTDDELSLADRVPQYRITVKPRDKESECTVVVAVMQKYQRIKRAENRKIGFEIYELKDPKNLPKSLSVRFFKRHTPVNKNWGFPRREICYSVQLKAGTYCIVPQIWRPQGKEEFLLRVYARNFADDKESDGEDGTDVVDEAVPELGPVPDEDA